MTQPPAKAVSAAGVAAGVFLAYLFYGGSLLALALVSDQAKIVLLLGIPQFVVLLAASLLSRGAGYRGLAIGLVIGGATAWMLLPAACFGVLFFAMIRQ